MKSQNVYRARSYFGTNSEDYTESEATELARLWTRNSGKPASVTVRKSNEEAFRATVIRTIGV